MNPYHRALRTCAWITVFLMVCFIYELSVLHSLSASLHHGTHH